MKVALLTCDQVWQRTLAARLAARVELTLVVIDRHVSLAARAERALLLLGRPTQFLRKLRAKLRVMAMERRDNAIYERHFGRLGSPPFSQFQAPVVHAPDINAEEVALRLREAGPDLIVVSGTKLIRSPVLDVAPPLGMLNLHTGLSPYYRGGPCTFWTLYNEEPEYAGVTVHHLTPGVDSGDIILSGRPEFGASEGVASLDSKVIDLGQQLLLRAIDLTRAGRAPCVPQWERGRLFSYKQFTSEARLSLDQRLRSGLLARCLHRVQDLPVRLVDVE